MLTQIGKFIAVMALAFAVSYVAFQRGVSWAEEHQKIDMCMEKPTVITETIVGDAGSSDDPPEKLLECDKDIAGTLMLCTHIPHEKRWGWMWMINSKKGE